LIHPITGKGQKNHAVKFDSRGNHFEVNKKNIPGKKLIFKQSTTGIYFIDTNKQKENMIFVIMYYIAEMMYMLLKISFGLMWLCSKQIL